jgi:hypothetical protein
VDSAADQCSSDWCAAGHWCSVWASQSPSRRFQSYAQLGHRSTYDAEARSVDLLRRTPRLKDELLDKVDKGELADLEKFGLLTDDLTAFVEGRPTVAARFSTIGGSSSPSIMPRDSCTQAPEAVRT